MHNGSEAAVVYAQTGRMYNSAREYAKAAHYYKLHIMSNLGNAGLPGENGDSSALTCIAGAYDWHSVQTGEPMLCMLCLTCIAGAHGRHSVQTGEPILCMLCLMAGIM